MPRSYEGKRSYWRKTKTLIREAKNRPCADCGVQYPYYVMQFDHRPDETKRNCPPSRRTAVPYDWPVADVLAEIAKCDVVCANCHAERTYQREIMKHQGDDE